ncbi:MAG: hypothetical protein JXO48_09695 [Deltaproteobacteria bacterium]|nr:hypothetical protein [Deltaproteobacteria bacterium]
MEIHLIEAMRNFTKLPDDLWENGYWKLNEEKARELVGSKIYFHRKRTERSFYGGIIKGYRVEKEGDNQGEIVFKFEYSKTCRNIRTDQSGWSRGMKVTTKT